MIGTVEFENTINMLPNDHVISHLLLLMDRL